MEKHSWNKVHCNLKASSHPTPRWGHSCCLIGQTIVYFGGYADSTYMNDLWAFNTLTMDWTQIETTGDVPSHRSNCSMCFDEKNNRIVLYGGGAPNKKRFNSIHLLDWTTKQWTEILPKQNEQAPWERTYHTAELFYPYLVIFGGEGMTDMDDVWAFNFETLSWTQITLEQDSPKPCARRFHSSVKIGNQFFIIAGCHGKYRCLNDIYSMDVTELLQNKITTLRWRQRKVKGSTFLTRWGHSSTVYDGKIYIFGGRFSNDLNDILVVDLEKQTMKAMKTNIEVPKARRRHSACFVGSNMIVFGGFNGEYFNDLHYINVFQVKKKIEARPSNTLSKSNFTELLASAKFSDGSIRTSSDEEFPIHKALIRRYFSCELKMEEFLADSDGKYSKKQLEGILLYFYRGFGQQDFDSDYLSLAEAYQIELPETESEKEVQFFKKLFYESKEFLSIVPKKSNIMTAPVISLSEDEYINFLQVMRCEIYCDASIVFNKEYCLPVSKSLLKMNSDYFNALFSCQFAENDEIHLAWECSKTSIIVFEVMVNYLVLGRVVISKEFELDHWIQLIQMAEYYSLTHLKEICEQQMCAWVPENCEKLTSLSLLLNLKTLGLSCADHQIKMMVNKEDKYQIEYSQSQNEKLNEKREHLLKEVYGLLRFDILQSRIEAESQLETSFKKKDSECEEKQNYENNFGMM